MELFSALCGRQAAWNSWWDICQGKETSCGCAQGCRICDTVTGPVYLTGSHLIPGTYLLKVIIKTDDVIGFSDVFSGSNRHGWCQGFTVVKPKFLKLNVIIHNEYYKSLVEIRTPWAQEGNSDGNLNSNFQRLTPDSNKNPRTRHPAAASRNLRCYLCLFHQLWGCSSDQ